MLTVAQQLTADRQRFSPADPPAGLANMPDFGNNARTPRFEGETGSDSAF